MRGQGGCFTNVSRTLQNDLTKIHDARNRTSDIGISSWKCMALRICTHFQLEILTRSTISAIQKFRENILESSRNVSHRCSYVFLMYGPEGRTLNFNNNAAWCKAVQSQVSIYWNIQIKCAMNMKIWRFYCTLHGTKILIYIEKSEKNVWVRAHGYGWPTLPQFDHGYALLNTRRVALLSYALRNKSNA